MTSSCAVLIAFSAIFGDSGLGTGRSGFGRPADATPVVRCRVFEVTAADADRLVPKQGRKRIAESSYSVAVIPAQRLGELVRARQAETGILVDNRRPDAGWPPCADTWAYSKADRQMVCGGTGAGLLGTRRIGETREIRVDYQVFHRLDPTGPSPPSLQLKGPIRFEGKLGKDESVVFVSSYPRAGRTLVHVIAFERADSE